MPCLGSLFAQDASKRRNSSTVQKALLAGGHECAAIRMTCTRGAFSEALQDCFHRCFIQLADHSSVTWLPDKAETPLRLNDESVTAATIYIFES